MTFNIDTSAPWVQAKLDLENQNSDSQHALFKTSKGTVQADLDKIFSSKQHTNTGDRFISKGGLYHKSKKDSDQKRATRHLVSTFIKNKVTRRQSFLTNSTGDIQIEEILVFDDNDDHFSRTSHYKNSKLKNQTADLFLRKVSGQDEYENITEEVLRRADQIISLMYEYDALAQGPDPKFKLKDSKIDFNTLFDTQEFDKPILRTESEQKDWDQFNVLDRININFLLTLYRIHRMAELSKTPLYQNKLHLRDALRFEILRRTIDTASPAHLRKKPLRLRTKHQKELFKNQNRYEAEGKFISDVLYSSLQLEKIKPLYSRTEEIGMIVMEANHLIDMTDGEYGIEILRDLSHEQWELILEDEYVTKSIFETLSNTIYVQSLTFYRNLYGEETEIRYRLLDEILLSVPKEFENGEYFKIITACALADGMKKQLNDLDMTLAEFANTPKDNPNPERAQRVREFCEKHSLIENQFTLGQLIHFYLNDIHQDNHGKSYAHNSVVDIALETIGTLSNKRTLPQQFRLDSITWTQTFLENFKTFIDKDKPISTQETQRSYDRDTIKKAIKVLPSLDAIKAQEFLFKRQKQPLDPTFEPRAEQIHLAHNANYQRVIGAEMLARLAGQGKLAFGRRLDLENGEWGRDFERKLSDPLFRRDGLKLWKQPTEGEPQSSANEIISVYDPDGVLQRNLAFVHLLRYYYTNPFILNPLAPISKEHQEEALARQKQEIDGLNLSVKINKALPPNAYEPHQNFQAWIKQVRKTNPTFFVQLLNKVTNAPASHLKLNFEIFIAEVNATETFQYFIDPKLGPERLLDYVGNIRSWTSGYHGRVLSRMQVFMDQDAIRQGKLGSDEKPLHADHPDILEHYANTIGLDQFYDPEDGVQLYLLDAQEKTKNPNYQLPVSEAKKILDHFSKNDFATYIPDWLFFIIEHRFITPGEPEDFSLMTQAFDILETTKYPKGLIAREFKDRGYLDSPDNASINSADKDRQESLQYSAKRCLKKLPKARAKRIRYTKSIGQAIRPRIIFASKHSRQYSPEHLEKILAKFKNPEHVQPGHYFEYRRLARRLLKSHDDEAIMGIVQEALSDKVLQYPDNAPFKVLFNGIIGYVVNDSLLDKSTDNIAVSSPGDAKGLFNFSAILVRWADRNHIDLNQVLGEAFLRYQAPGHIKSKHEEMLAIDQLIDNIESISIKMALNTSFTADDIHQKLNVELHAILDDLLTAKSSKSFNSAEKLNIKHLIKTIQTVLGDFDDNPDLSSDHGLLNLYEEFHAILPIFIEAKFRKQDELDNLFAELRTTAYNEQNIIQALSYLYNSVRRQFLKEILISEGEASGEMIERQLQNTLLPQRERLLTESRGRITNEVKKLDEQIDFLISVLAQIEGEEYFNDFNATHKKSNRFFKNSE